MLCALLSSPISTLCIPHPEVPPTFLLQQKLHHQKRPRKPAKRNPLASDPGFSRFSLTATTSTSAHSSTPMPFPDISTETATTGPYVTPFTFKFIPNFTPDAFLKARGEEREEIASRRVGPHNQVTVMYTTS